MLSIFNLDNKKLENSSKQLQHLVQTTELTKNWPFINRSYNCLVEISNDLEFNVSFISRITFIM